jgi:hypothetical protein
MPPIRHTVFAECADFHLIIVPMASNHLVKAIDTRCQPCIMGVAHQHNAHAWVYGICSWLMIILPAIILY